MAAVSNPARREIVPQNCFRTIDARIHIVNETYGRELLIRDGTNFTHLTGKCIPDGLDDISNRHVPLC